MATIEVTDVDEITLEDEEDSVEVHLPSGYCLTVFGNGSVELWSPGDLVGEHEFLTTSEASSPVGVLTYGTGSATL